MEALNERGECEKRAPEHRVTSASGGRRAPLSERLELEVLGEGSFHGGGQGGIAEGRENGRQK